MVWVFRRAAASREKSSVLVGGRLGAGEKASQNLTEAFPGLRVAHHFPPFGFERRAPERAALRRAIRETGADVVSVGLGFPSRNE